MKATVAVILVAGASLAGCTRVIERPVPAAPSVVTTPAVIAPAAAGGTAAACAWNGQPTSHGGMSCQEHSQFRCNNGTWERTALSC